MSKKTGNETNLHVVPHDNGWAVRREGADRVSRICSTQTDAATYARTVAQREQGEVFIHRPDGTIRDRDSYGHDPFPPRDRKH